MPELQVGQELWCVQRDSRWRVPFWRRVKKIGRKWAYLDGHAGRVNKVTLEADGGEYSSPFQAWRSKEEWEAHVEARKLWSALVKVYPSYSPPPTATPARIREVAALLGIELPETVEDQP